MDLRMSRWHHVILGTIYGIVFWVSLNIQISRYLVYQILEVSIRCRSTYDVGVHLGLCTCCIGTVQRYSQPLIQRSRSRYTSRSRCLDLGLDGSVQIHRIYDVRTLAGSHQGQHVFREYLQDTVLVYSWIHGGMPFKGMRRVSLGVHLGV